MSTTRRPMVTTYTAGSVCTTLENLHTFANLPLDPAYNAVIRSAN